MRNLFLIPILALMLFSINTNAQCCPVSKTEKTVAVNNNLQTAKTVKFKITGITCAGCSNTIYKALKEVDGVIEHSVEYPGDIAIIEFDDSKTNIQALKKVIEKKGYKVEIVKEMLKEKV
tara:strand:- start:184 stop:543 length:360 start_codon:yes stop_codon:yes gene_type:complete